jgi:hypothetical protein
MSLIGYMTVMRFKAVVIDREVVIMTVMDVDVIMVFACHVRMCMA